MKKEQEEPIDEKPPILGSWRNIYFLLIGFLFFLILIFSILTNLLQ